jgi:Restriction endonuclease NaeI
VNLFPTEGYRPLGESHQDFADLTKLESDLLAAVGGREMFVEKLRSFFRSAIDEVIDTARTGRFFLAELDKTEKTYIGTKFEILLRDWLQVPRGVAMDFLIGGQEVDVKSTTGGGWGWMIPKEAVGELCILLRVNEDQSKCAFGLVRARKAYLRAGENRDLKTGISAEGRAHIWWLIQDFAYTPNFWTQIDGGVRSAIMDAGRGKKRLAALFENCIGLPISRVQVAAVAAQDDYMKRLRKNGGARDILAPKGIAILYSETDRALMHQLGLTFGHREFLSHRPRDASEAALLRSAGKIE